MGFQPPPLSSRDQPSLCKGLVVELIGHGYVAAANNDVIRLAPGGATAIVFPNEWAATRFLAGHAPLVLQTIPVRFHARSFAPGDCGSAA
jgi:hypothetical protein